MKLLPAVKIRYYEHLRGFATFFGVLLLIMLIFASNWLGMRSGSISMSTTAAYIFGLVMGVCVVREDMRLLIQFGYSRRTGFISRLLAALALAVTSAVLCHLLMLFITSIDDPRIRITELFQLLYLENGAISTLGQHLASIVINIAIFLALYEFGEFFSLIFLHTRRWGTVLLAVLMGLLPTAILPGLLSLDSVYHAVIPRLASLAQWLTASVGNLILAAVLAIVVNLAVNYLLTRRVPIVAARR